MGDYNARHVIEALRSGVPSRAVGAYFSEARPTMQKKLQDKLQAVRAGEKSDGMIVTGRYGEGKTHLLNSVFNMAFEENMAVSMVSLGKETPVDRPWLLFQKLMENIYLPGASQPGLRSRLEEITQGSSIAGDLLAYAAAELETDKLYYMLKALFGTQEEEERIAFMSDLEGDFATAALIKRSCRRITGSPVKFRQSFTKTKHSMDYFYFTSHLIRQLGCSGWVILLDEAELIGRMGKKTRAKSYVQMQNFLNPPPGMEHVFTLFAFSSSFSEDVIDRKHEFENVAATYEMSPDERKKAEETLNAILHAPELSPLTEEEITKVLMSIQDFHGKAYGWQPEISAGTLLQATEAGGYLLRTKIRSAIEFFDQLYQYGEAGTTRVTELGKENLEEEVSELPEL